LNLNKTQTKQAHPDMTSRMTMKNSYTIKTTEQKGGQG